MQCVVDNVAKTNTHIHHHHHKKNHPTYESQRMRIGKDKTSTFHNHNKLSFIRGLKKYINFPPFLFLYFTFNKKYVAFS